MAQEISTIGKSFLDGIKESAGEAIAVGVVLVIAGFLAMGSPLVAGLSVSVGGRGTPLVAAWQGRMVL